MNKKTMTPAINDESAENKLIALALRQAQKQLEDQTASSQVVTHFLRLGSIRAKIELEKLELENLLLVEKIEAEKSGRILNEQFSEVIAALRSYSYLPPGATDADVF